MTNLTGKHLGRYQILERIGQGGMAEVYKGYQPTLDRAVAVKVLHAFMTDTAGSDERFAREAKAVAGLRHPNIVQVFDFDTAEGTAFMVMEYVDGPNLKRLMDDAAASGTPLSLERIGEIITAVGGALGYAHRWGMIHRDVKPHNILFTSSGVPLLTDFGIAKILSSATITDPSQISGTPAYMSPEQGRGGVLDRRTDIYSLGIVLYEMLTGRVPFTADTPFAVVIKQINDPIPPPRGINPAIPLPLERVVMKVTAKAPEDRYQTAEEFVKALNDAIAEVQAQAAAPVVLPPPMPSQSVVTGTPPLPANRAADPPADNTPPPPANGTPSLPAYKPGQGMTNTPPLAARTNPPMPAPAAQALPPTVMPAQMLPANLGAGSAPTGTQPRGPSRVKDDSVTIRLVRPEVIMTAGAAPVENTAIIANPSQQQENDQYNFEIMDLDPAWYEIDVRSVLLWRGDQSQVPIRFTVPRKGKAGVYTYRLRAVSVSNPDMVGYTTGRLHVSSPSTMQMSIQPASVTATVGHYEVLMANGPVGGLIVELEGREPTGVLEFIATPDKVRLAAGEEATVQLEVRARAGAVGEAQPYPFTLVANLTGTDETNLPIEVQGELVLQPAVELQVLVESEGVHWPLGDYRVVLTNPTSLTLDVDMQAEDPSGVLGVYFQGENENLHLKRGETAIVKAIARANDATQPTEPVHAPFVVRVHARNIEGPGEWDHVFESALDYTPPPPVEEPDPLDFLAVELALGRVEGEPATVNVKLVSTGTMPMLTILRARDENNVLDYSFEPPQLYLEPGQSETAKLTLRRANPDSKDQTVVPFEVICGVAGAKGGRLLTARGEWVPPPPVPVGPPFTAVLIPIQPEGVEGTYEVHMTSNGDVPVNVVLRGKDTSGLLNVKLTPPRVTLAAGGQAIVKVAVTTNALEPLSEEHTYPFEVICWVPSSNAVRSLTGEYRCITF